MTTTASDRGPDYADDPQPLIVAQQIRPLHPLGFHIWRDKRGWVRWSQRIREAWWILTGKWSLHRAWQVGCDQGSLAEYKRIIVNKGDIYFLLTALRPFARILDEYEHTLSEGETFTWPEWVGEHCWPSQKECEAARDALRRIDDYTQPRFFRAEAP